VPPEKSIDGPFGNTVVNSMADDVEMADGAKDLGVEVLGHPVFGRVADQSGQILAPVGADHDLDARGGIDDHGTRHDSG
jgi:hypothetical protein